MEIYLDPQDEQEIHDLSPVVDPGSELPIAISLINYCAEEVVERHHVTLNECKAIIDLNHFTWIHVQGRPRPAELRELGSIFHLHPLALEDVINLGERSKTETYGDLIMVILGLPNQRGNRIISEQVTLFLGKNFLISFHNGEEDPFRAVRRRLHHPQAAMRREGIDYLLYILIDVILDHGFPILENFEEDIEEVEQKLLGPKGEDTIETLFTIKRELLVLRLKMRPQREAIHTLMRDDNHLLGENTKLHLRDCYDHIIRVVDILEIYRDMTTNMLDVHLSLVNKKTFTSNEVQRKVGVYALIFASITFVTGIYGMNFANMPETNWRFGYLLVLGGMLALALGLWRLFKFKRWL